MDKKRFRVAFSFSGAKRDYVSEVAAVLAIEFGRKAILYDRFHEAEFGRRDLGIYLPDLYFHEADLVVVVLGGGYETKEWCGLEWTAIHALLARRDDDRVMLCRFDHATVRGLYGTAGYVDLDDKAPAQAAAIILQRLAVNEQGAADRAGPGVPDALTTTRNNLPRLASFYGRANELKKIADALLPDRRTWGVLIDGPGGMGKTSLAIKAADEVPAGQFDRILFLSAKDREMSAGGERKLIGFVVPGYLEMLNEIARLLGITGFTERPEAERPRLVSEALVQKRVLLILDNLESLAPEHRDQLFSFLGRLPEGCKAIVTSRLRTDIDARIIRLERLDREAALAFLAELAIDRPLLAKASPEERLHLYEETGGNPLMMRWIAGQLGRGQCRSVPAALDFMRNAPPGNDPLEFVFGDLVKDFSESETRALAALSYFSRPMEVRFVAELAMLTVSAAQTALGDLASRALVVPDETETSFVLVPMVADFLRHKRPAVVQQTGDRLADRAYALIVENGYRKHDRFPILDAAWATISPAILVFLAGPRERLQTVCTALQSFYEFTGRLDERLSLSLRVEEKAVAENDLLDAGWRAYDAGWIRYLQRQADEVRACAERATDYWARANAGAREQAVALRLQGLGHQVARDYAAAAEAYREAIELDRSLSAESEDMAIGLNALAEAERLVGDLDAAERDYREALRIANAIGDLECIADYNGGLIELALDRQQWEYAETLAVKALADAEKIGRKMLMAKGCDRLAKAIARQGRKNEAIAYARRGVDLFTELGSGELQEAHRTLLECQG